MALSFRGLLTCQQRKTAEVELTLELRDRLAAGELPCPCCGTPCRPTFVLQPVASFLVWNSGHWSSHRLHEDH